MQNSNIMLLALIGKVVDNKPLPEKQGLKWHAIAFSVALGVAAVALAFI